MLTIDLTLNLTLVVIAKNQPDLDAFNQQNLDGVAWVSLVTNDAQWSLARLANYYLDRCGTSVFGLCHADMEFGPGSLKVFVDCCLAGKVCGACARVEGLYPFPFDYMWSHNWGNPTPEQIQAGHPLEVSGPLVLSSSDRVSTLDSSCIFFPTDRGLRFDEATFDGYHQHGEDLCMQAHSKGIPVVLPSANAFHACKDTNGPNWGAERDKYKHMLLAKWPQYRIVTT